MAGRVSSRGTLAADVCMAATEPLALVDRKISSARVTMASKVSLEKVM